MKQTTFRGFKEYTGSNSDGQPIPRGFYQPIFDTTTQEHTLSLDADHCAVIHLPTPRPDAPTLENLGVKIPPFESDPYHPPPQPMLLVVETLPAK